MTFPKRLPPAKILLGFTIGQSLPAILMRAGLKVFNKKWPLSFSLLLLLAACEKPVNVNDLPVSYWADPKSLEEDHVGYADSCSLASAQAIVKAGLPFPNFGTKDELSADGKAVGKRISTVDVWLGGVRYVFPAELVSSTGYPAHNPNRFNKLHGTLPNFYPKGPHAPIKDGMGAMVDVSFKCSLEPEFLERVRKQPSIRTLEEGVQYSMEMYKATLARDPSLKGEVTYAIREDLAMIEVLKRNDASRKEFWGEATYWPIKTPLRKPDGTLSPIGCQTRHVPNDPQAYGNRGWTCGASIGLTPGVSVLIEIYVAHLEHMPQVFEQVKQVVINARKAGEQ